MTHTQVIDNVNKYITYFTCSMKNTIWLFNHNSLTTQIENTVENNFVLPNVKFIDFKITIQLGTD